MPKFVALLRGINVGGRNKVPMPRLREALQLLGHTDVVTHLQSGNVVLSTTRAPAGNLAEQLETLVRREFDVDVRVLVLRHEDIAGVVAQNPLPEAVAEPSKFHVAFLWSAPARAQVSTLDASAFPNEEIRVIGAAAYLWYRDGLGRSKLTLDVVERRLQVTGTMRNWNTVTKLLELSRAD